MNKNIIISIFICLFSSTLTGCLKPEADLLTHVPQTPLWQAQLSAQQHASLTYFSDFSHFSHLSMNKVRKNFLAQYPLEVQQAFLAYEKTGEAQTIRHNDFIGFPYSENAQPIVICAPLYTCDITLGVGETIINLTGGDTARWLYRKIDSGQGDLRQPHVLVKPKFPDISTNLVIMTTQRTYHIGLVASENHYFRQAKFYYPSEMQRQLTALQKSLQDALQQAKTVKSSLPNIDPSLFDQHYCIKNPNGFKNPPWKPVRAFNDGTHVFIEMPAQIRVTDAPVLFIRTSDGNKALVNYRIKDNYYIVDQLFKQAILVSGVGNAQEKISITYTG